MRQDEFELPLGAPTSIGSLPHRDRDEAIAFVLDRTPELPAAPTVPALEPLERMIPQAAWGIAGVEIADDGTVTVPDPAAVDPAAPLGDPHLSGRPFTTWRLFLDVVAGRDDPIKLQLTGPLTLGLTLVAAGVVPSVAFPVASRVPWPNSVVSRLTAAPVPSVLGPASPNMVCGIKSAKLARVCLKPVVLTLAILSPITDRLALETPRPLAPTFSVLNRDMIAPWWSDRTTTVHTVQNQKTWG